MTLGIILAWAGFALMVISIIRYRWRITVLDVAADLLLLAGNAVQDNWLWTGVWAVVLIVNLRILWRRRRDRRRSLAALGAKSRARLAAMVRSMRERARPRRVFRPAPQGSPA